MQHCDGLFAGVALAVIGLAIIYKAYREWRTTGMTRRVPASPCGSVTPGQLVQVAGRALGDATITSAVLGAPCFVSRVQVDAHIRKKKSKVWRQAFKDEQGVPFYVEDQSGRVRVDPVNADLQLAPMLEFSSEEPAKLKAEMLERVRQAGMNPESLHYKLKELYAQDFEKRLETSEVPVLGIFFRVVAFLSRRPYRPLLPNDSPMIQKMRHDAARAASSYQPLRCKEESIQPGDLVYILGPAQEITDGGSATAVVIARGNPSNPFLIGGGTRAEVRRRMNRSARKAAAWGLGFMGAAAFVLIRCYYGH